MDRMTPDQREAFGLWYGKALSSSEITSGRQSLVVDTGNVIAYLPFHIFQHLSPAQVTAALSSDTWLGNLRELDAGFD